MPGNSIRTQVAVRMAGSAPHYLFTRDCNSRFSPSAWTGGGAHGVNEFLVIDAAAPARGLAFLERSFVDLVYRFANSMTAAFLSDRHYVHFRYRFRVLCR